MTFLYVYALCIFNSLISMNMCTRLKTLFIKLGVLLEIFEHVPQIEKYCSMIIQINYYILEI